MTIWTKSGWPVIGHNEVNSGEVTRQSVPGFGVGTMSSLAASDVAGMDKNVLPDWLMRIT
jgi:hypothetical protein